MVFGHGDGRRLHPNTVEGQFGRQLQPAGLFAITLHGQRHTCATLLLAGVPIHSLAERLGHKSAAVTLDVHAHVVGRSDREVADRPAAMLADEAPRSLAEGA